MVAGKVKAAMGFQRSPATPKAETPRRSSCSPASHHKPSAASAGGHQPPPPPPPSSNGKASASFARSFGVYFPRASAQVQPRPPDVAELLRLVEELQEKESRLRTQLLEQKLLKETVAIVPFLEKEIAARGEELARAAEKFERLEAENRALRDEVEALSSKIRGGEEESRRREKRIRDLETELGELKKASTEQSNGESRRLCARTGDRRLLRFQNLIDVSARSNLSKSMRKAPRSTDIGPGQEVQKLESRDPRTEEGEGEAASRPARGGEKEDALRPRAPRVPKPPPTPSISCNSSTSSSSSSSSTTSETTSGVPTSRGPSLASLPPIPPPAPAVGPALTGCPRPPPPPPPPPPPSKGSRLVAASVRRVPEVVEFYHSLMRRDSKREPGGVAPDVAPASSAAAANARDMIGEIENRSAHLLAIKTDVETQGDFIRFLIKEVEHAAFTNVEDVVAFVKWLDDELSFLVDERAVLKHFEWPEHKADAMREAAFGYCDLKKLVSEASSLRDGPRQPCASALKKVQAHLLEQGVYNLSRVREGSTKRYKGFGIPWEWMLESGYVNQIKLASVKLAMKYMKRVSSELENIAGSPEEEELMLQGVRFAFRVHQFAGGFDVETMRAFQELKDKAHSLRLQSPHHHHHKLYCRHGNFGDCHANGFQ
ncbi:chloroplast unusual positioning protein [Musa troglodytarum]|uniref:Chloroplast unusual positioning protein n=1 Tax=Musa troglodytarum TaxID=320322 RepID=A0A9E7IHX6_9LILI|nr:chloroplast unusual positioning protein [Musa troglodytarum]